jgi:hypothetical protein
MAQLTNLASNCKSKLNSISSLQGSMESLNISKPSRQTHSPKHLQNSLNEDRIMQPKDKQSESFDTFAGGDQKPSSPAFKEESIDQIYKKFQEDQERIIEDELNKNQLFSNILI